MSIRRNPNLGSSQARARKRRLFFIRFYIILFFVLVVVFSLAILSGHEKIIIKEYVLSGNDSVINSEILKIVDRDTAGRYLGLFSKSNFLIFPRFKIEKDILNDIKTIKEVDVSWQKWQVVEISVVERKPHSVWCGPDPKAADQTCYFVDKNGYIFSRAPIFSGNLFVKNYSSPVIADEVGADPIGNYFLSPAAYTQIYSMIEALDKKALNVISVYFDGTDFNFTLANGISLIFNNKNGDFISAFQNLFTAIDSKNLDLINGADKINYIDLRFQDKVVVGKKGS